jgi:hypothetical protein
MKEAGSQQRNLFGNNPSNLGVQLGEVVGRASEGAITPFIEEVVGYEVPEVVQAIINPGGYLASKLSGTWLCTEIGKHIDVPAEQKTAIKKLRRYTRRNHRRWLSAYFADGPLLVDGINRAENDRQAFYSSLYDRLVVPVVNLVTEDKMKEAFELYKQVTIDLCKQYAPQIETEVQ